MFLISITILALKIRFSLWPWCTSCRYEFHGRTRSGEAAVCDENLGNCACCKNSHGFRTEARLEMRCEDTKIRYTFFVHLRAVVQEIQRSLIVTDETYTKLTQLFQGYLVNEVDLNPQGTCRENCGYYEYTKVHGCFKNQFCSQQRKCKGRVLKCDYIDSDMWVCPAVNWWFFYIYAESFVIRCNMLVNCFSHKTAIEDTNTYSLKMVAHLDKKLTATVVQQRWIAGGVGCFGIAVTVFAIATIATRALIDTSVCGRSYPMCQITSTCFIVIHLDVFGRIWIECKYLW